MRQAPASPLPPPKRRPSSRPAPKLGPYRALIDGWLEADREAPRKQRHTAKRVWRRLLDEHGAGVSQTTVRDYVRARRRELVDRLTHKAHIIETGEESWRFRHGLARREKGTGK